VKDISQFNKNNGINRSKLRVNNWCKSCVHDYDRERYLKYKDQIKSRNRNWYRKNERADRDRVLRRKYGITIEQYEHMVKLQGNKCAICEKEHNENGVMSRLPIDHCHKTGKIRGLLCNNCNRAIGLLQDNPAIVAKALLYLNNHFGGEEVSITSTAT
jgi:hypothetical protein